MSPELGTLCERPSLRQAPSLVQVNMSWRNKITDLGESAVSGRGTAFLPFPRDIRTKLDLGFILYSCNLSVGNFCTLGARFGLEINPITRLLHILCHLQKV